MEIEKLVGWLESNGWEYRLSKGSITIANPHFGTETEYSFSVVERNTLENILLPHFLEGWRKSGNTGEYLGPHHVNV